jgi:hypothetical protein
MTHFQFIVLVCAGMITILAAVSIIVGAIMKKDSGEIKKPCAEKFAAVKEEQTDKFEKIERCLSEIEGGAKARNDRILILETRFTEIISRMTRVETAVDKNAEMTRMIYEHMAKRKANGDTPK